MKLFSKNRMEIFTDAVVAIILTMMVLELPLERVGNSIDFKRFIISLAIYLISFCFVANVWYQRTLIFEQQEFVEQRFVFLDILLLFFLSLYPPVYQNNDGRN